MHINVLELKAAFIEIHMYCQKRSFKHIRVMSDNSTAIVYIKVTLSPKNAMNLQKRYGYGVLKIIILSLQLTYQENNC